MIHYIITLLVLLMPRPSTSYYGSFMLPQVTYPPSQRLKSPSLLVLSASRRNLLTSASSAASSAILLPLISNAEEDTGSQDILQRARKLAEEADAKEREAAAIDAMARSAARGGSAVISDKNIYDFSVPVKNADTGIADLVSTDGEKPKAVLFVNIKQDDPQARTNIPQLLQLTRKYSPSLVVVCVPTDQGYYEPDTSALLRLKVASEYGYGGPGAVLTDKVNLLGTGAHPLMRWLESTQRTPEGLGRIQLNFEKFLVDGATGLPVRRYPRKYQPKLIEDDILALLAGKTVGPAGGGWLEEWRQANREADTSEYAFKKGLNWYDQ